MQYNRSYTAGARLHECEILEADARAKAWKQLEVKAVVAQQPAWKGLRHHTGLLQTYKHVYCLQEICTLEQGFPMQQYLGG